MNRKGREKTGRGRQERGPDAEGGLEEQRGGSWAGESSSPITPPAAGEPAP